MHRNIQSKPMKEILYRESRLAKALGDPAKYAIVTLLLKNGPLTVSEIAKNVKRSPSTVSHHLNQLKNLEFVRYEAKSDGSYYWIKYPIELKQILDALNNFIKRTLHKVNEEM